jgi:TRAP-type C4-dicarboxylate transport system substrate-binding protein
VKVILVNKAFFDSLTPVDQAAMLEAARFIQDEQRVDQRAAEETVKQKCKAQGIQVFELDEAERQRWIRACQQMREQFSKMQGKELLEKITAE